MKLAPKGVDWGNKPNHLKLAPSDVDWGNKPNHLKLAPNGVDWGQTQSHEIVVPGMHRAHCEPDAIDIPSVSKVIIMNP